MTEGYADRTDPGLTVRFPLVDRPGESLLVWTTTPWTLTSNVAAAVGPELRYVKVRQGEAVHWLGRGTLRQALAGPFEVLEEVAGSELVGWRYRGPFDDLPAVRAAFAAGGPDGRPYEHRVVAWDEVGEEEGTGIVHIAPGCGAEDFALGKALGLPMLAPLDEGGVFIDGFGFLTGRDVRDSVDPVLEHLKHHGLFHRLEPYVHRYPHCWRCGTPLVFRLVDEWYISMGQVYDRPRCGAHAGRGRRQPPLPDHGGRRRDPLDPGVRLRARARLAPEHARLDDQQEAVLGPRPADLRLRRLRHLRRDRRPRGAARSAPSTAGRRSRATRRTDPTSTRSRSPARAAAPR